MNGRTTRPWTVALGCAVSLAISVYDVVTAVSDEEIVESRGFLALLVALSIIPVIFTVAAFFRRNWGRIGLAVITGLGIVSVPVFVLLSAEAAEALDVETIVYALAGVVVIVLLFMPASNQWYRRDRASHLANT